MANNKNSRVWQVGRDHVGNAVLEWNPKTLRAERVELYEEPEPDPLDKTYNLLKRLDCNLVLEDGSGGDEDFGHNPYDTGNHKTL
jgi:hypothetical protein